MPESNPIFPVLILTARPAAGKSETLHYLRSLPVDERIRRFHIGEMIELDDFPMLWTWFEEDDLLEKLGLPRLHSDSKYYFLRNEYWHLLIERLSFDYEKLIRRKPSLHDTTTVLVEFSRGAESGGYREALPHLSPDLLRRAALMYLKVSFEESLRKNRARFRPDEADSILFHGLPDEKMLNIYRHDDFAEVAAADPRFLTVHGIRVPYAIFDNEDDVTSGDPALLGARLEETLARLWEMVNTR